MNQKILLRGAILLLAGLLLGMAGGLGLAIFGDRAWPLFVAGGAVVGGTSALLGGILILILGKKNKDSE